MKNTPILLAGLLAVSAAAFAQTATDTDARGEHRQQRQQRADAAFNQSDSNHDGKLSQSEWQSARMRESADKFRSLDSNRDGKLSREELQAAHAKHQGGRAGGLREKMRGLDTDGDQQLSRAEIGEQMPRLAQDFDRIDANHDGKLSREELQAARPK
ncbi:MAG: EF-hand domain-containing protein, partial [Arenimonas sp.]